MSEEKIDLEKEIERMENSTGDWWKPKPGKHEIVFIGTPEYRPDNEIEGEPAPQYVAQISKEKEQLLWGISRGKTSKSLWYKLCKVAAANGGFNGLKITLHVDGEGRDREYTVLEYLQLPEEVDMSED